MTTRERARERFTTIHSIDEIPDFASEQEDHEFWSTHDLSAELLAQATWDPDDPAAPPLEEQQPQHRRR